MDDLSYKTSRQLQLLHEKLVNKDYRYKMLQWLLVPADILSEYFLIMIL